MVTRSRFLTHALGLVAIGAVVFGIAILARGPDAPPQAYPAADLEPLTPEKAAAEGYRLAPTLLLAVYQAFGETEEEAIYDQLATVAADEALETLYLERRGAMVGGGLTQTDQTIHEMRLLTLETRRTGETLHMDAVWQVIGTVGHSEHEHVRGNAYSADLTVEPVDGAWRLTGFDLRDVDRTLAGTATEAADSW